MSGLLPLVEHAVKKPIWDCRMCGQCVLHSTGMTCPMTCPKTLRNGPCGGVREDGHCEVKPEMECIWAKGLRRSRTLPLPRTWRAEFDHTRPPVDNGLQGTSSWINLVTGRDRRTPDGWPTVPASTRSEDAELVEVGAALAELDEVEGRL